MSNITIRGARLHNLKNISLSLPKYRLIVFTGLSGSGKSSLAFDLLHKEGQRQYMESLGMVTYESRPPVDSISGLSPTISVGQNSANRSPRSTVGTASDVYTYLRVLFARTGHRPCPSCGCDVPPTQALDDPAVIDWEQAEIPRGPSPARMRCDVTRDGHGFFSFNKPGRAPLHGLGTIYSANLNASWTTKKPAGGGADLGGARDTTCRPGRRTALRLRSTRMSAGAGPAAHDLLLYGAESDEFRHTHIEPPAAWQAGASKGWCPTCGAGTPSTRPTRTILTWKNWSSCWCCRHAPSARGNGCAPRHAT
jgi:excinuclease ABC subunit A